jgi:hypothetical protein
MLHVAEKQFVIWKAAHLFKLLLLLLQVCGTRCAPAYRVVPGAWCLVASARARESGGCKGGGNAEWENGLKVLSCVWLQQQPVSYRYHHWQW